MQRQDDYQISRDDMLLFIAQLASLANLVIGIVARGCPADDRLVSSLRRSEYAMLVVLGGILGNVDTRGLVPGLDAFASDDKTIDRSAELARMAASYRQIAVSLALILSMFPRAFRDRSREDVLLSASRSPSAAGCAANGPAVVRALCHSPAASPEIPP